VLSLERHNHREIELLNQRGGRTLTVVDLIRAGTLSVPMAGYALRAMEQGASLLTGATSYEADSSGGHRLVFAWDPAFDAFRPTAALREPEELARYAQFIQQMVDDGESDAASVRRKVLAFYGRAVR
jgi:hypothetical protein